MLDPLVIPIMVLAYFVQSAVGFGSGLIAMPLLVGLLGMDTAPAAFAIAAQTMGVVLVWRYRHALDWRSVRPMLAAVLLGVPVGVLGARLLDEQVAMFGLGMVSLLYALYVLSGRHVPNLSPRLGFLFGGLGGLLHGAYNTPGPPYIIFGSSQNWPPLRFKGNLQALFFVGGVFTIIVHGLTGHITSEVIQYELLMIPAALVGVWLGGQVDRSIRPEPFRRAVLVLLAILGLTLIF